MSNKLYEENDIQNIANAIRNKNGTEDTYKVSQMPTAIDSIEVIESATAEGESLSLTNTKAMPYKDYKVKGKSEQATRSGKNLFNKNDVTLNARIGGDGNDYTADATGYYISNFIKVSPNTQYVRNSPITDAYHRLAFYSSNSVDTFISAIFANDITTPANCNYIRFCGLITEKNTIQLEQGTTPTSYEPYGVSPSPEYPSEIHSVADDDINIFNAEKINNYNIKVKDNGKTIIMPLVTSGNGNTNTSTKLNVLCPDLQVGDVIYIRFKRNLNNNRNKFIYLYGSNKIMYASENSPSYTITQEDLNSYVFLYGNDYDYGETEQCIITDFKIQKNTVPINYSPYNQGTVTIKQRGKNLFDGEIELGNINPDNGSLSNSTTRTRSKNFIKVEPNTTYSYSHTVGERRWIIGYTKNKEGITDGTAGYNSAIVSSNKPTEAIHFTTTPTTEYIKWYDTDCIDLTEHVQIEEGSTATSYEPYQTPHNYTLQTEPLRSLPNGVKDSKDTKQHTRVGRVVLDGSEEWITLDAQNTDNTFYVSSTIIDSTAKSGGYILSNIAIKGAVWGTDNANEVALLTNYSKLRFRVSKNIASTVQEWKTYLSNNYVEVVYELETEIIEPLTQNQATTMLDIIKTGSYEGTTNIYTDEDVKPTMKVGYYKKS